MAKQLEAHFHEEPKLWSFKILCQKQIMNESRESNERNLTWRIHFMHTICCFEAQEVSNPTLQIVHDSELKVIAIGSQSHQVEDQFHRLRNHKRDGWEMETFSLRNFIAILHACEILLSASRYLRPTLLNFFSSDIWCLTPHFLLVIYQS